MSKNLSFNGGSTQKVLIKSIIGVWKWISLKVVERALEKYGPEYIIENFATIINVPIFVHKYVHYWAQKEDYYANYNIIGFQKRY